MPRGHEHIPFSIYKHFLGHFSVKFSYNKIVIKKIVVLSMFGSNNDHFFPRNNYTVKDHIFNTKRVQRIVLMPPWASHNTPWIKFIQYGNHIGKRSIELLLSLHRSPHSVMEGKDSGIFSPCQNSNAHPPNDYSSDDDFDEEENQRSLR